MARLGARLVGYGLVVLFCIPGPLGLLFALDLIWHRAAFVHDAARAEGTVIWLEPVRTTRTGAGTCIPVFRFTAADGRSIIVNSSVSVPAATFKRGEAVRVLYLPDNPQIAHIDAIWTLWQESIVVSVWGAVWSSFPAILIVIRRRRRASAQLAPTTGPQNAA
jgi:hypothetical protein